MVLPPPQPSDIDPKLAAFDDVIAKGMAKKPGQALPDRRRTRRRRTRGVGHAGAPTGGVGRHSAGRAKHRRARSVRPDAGDRGAAVLLVRGAGVRGVALWGGATTADRRGRRRRRRQGLRRTRAEWCPRSRRRCPPTSRIGPADGRRQCALCTKRIQELRRGHRRLRRRPDQRGGEDARSRPRVSGVPVRRHHPDSAARRVERRDVVVHRHARAPGAGRLRQLLRSGNVVGAADRVGHRSQRGVRAAGRR